MFVYVWMQTNQNVSLVMLSYFILFVLGIFVHSEISSPNSEVIVVQHNLSNMEFIYFVAIWFGLSGNLENLLNKYTDNVF